MAGDARRVVVAGLGSEYRRDDGAGPAAVSLVVQQCPGVTVVAPLDDPLDLLGLWDGADLAVVVDAVSSGSPPERSRWWSSIPPPRGWPASERRRE